MAGSTTKRRASTHPFLVSSQEPVKLINAGGKLEGGGTLELANESVTPAGPVELEQLVHGQEQPLHGEQHLLRRNSVQSFEPGTQ